MNDMTPAELERAKSAPKRDPKADMFRAISSARGEFPEIPKNRNAVIRMKSGGQYSYKYADLADVFGAINPVLSAYGLAVWQEVNGLEIVTTIMHESGAERSTAWPIKPMPQRDLNDAQSFQSAVQVAKRYALTAALGISTEETVEGDPRATRKQNHALKINDAFEDGDGVRLPKGAKFDKGATPRQVAEEAARAIIAQFIEPKTIVGLNGVWNRNEVFIEKFREKHPDLFTEVFDAFAEHEALYQEADS